MSIEGFSNIPGLPLVTYDIPMVAIEMSPDHTKRLLLSERVEGKEAENHWLRLKLEKEFFHFYCLVEIEEILLVERVTAHGFRVDE